jgi:polygalacturonase
MPPCPKDSGARNATTGWVHVSDFGAVGDGVTDDTAAIPIDFTASTRNRGALIFPAGGFRVTRLVWKKGVYMRVPVSLVSVLQHHGYTGAAVRSFGVPAERHSSRCDESRRTNQPVHVNDGAPPVSGAGGRWKLGLRHHAREADMK